MTLTARTFRVFVSSTFSDLKAERNALQERVFERLRKLAAAYGCRFQAIDLRWGVSEEAALDQQTMKICLGEIERCQRVSPRPNFIVLLGNRYGWRPLPYEIPLDEFNQILPLIQETERALVMDWYRQDDNAIPQPVQVLQPRTGKYKEKEAWEPVERRLHTLLEATARKAGLPEASLIKYTTSATEQEVIQGAFHVVERDHIFCFGRELEGVPQDDRSEDFSDVAGGKPDTQAGEQLRDLKFRLKNVLGGNYHEYESKWVEGSPSLEHLDQLCADVLGELERVILQEVAALEQVDLLEKEISAHQVFGRERTRHFLGRAEILKQIDGYLLSNNDQPLAVWGPSGSGKSALMARAAQETKRTLSQGKVIQRFIGTTPDSSNGRSLLEGLCRQITRLYKGDESSLPDTYKELMDELPQRLSLATEEHPLVIFLDALDQLSEADNVRRLAWLPARLPTHVKLVVSTLPGQYIETLEKKIPGENCLELLPLPLMEGATLLDQLLQEAGRTLQPEQRADILGKYERCGLPLYLKLAFEEARRWSSYDGLPNGADEIPGLGADIAGILRDLFRRLTQESNHGEVLISHSLGYLAAAKNGLDEEEMLDVLSADQEILQDFRRRSPKSPEASKLPVVVWSRLYLDLEPYLAERSADGTSLLSFYHRQMGEAVTKIFLAGEAVHRRHLGLAQYFARQSLYLDSTGNEKPNLRKLSELPYQLAYANQSDELAGILSDFKYLEAVVSASGPQNLIEDYDLIQVPQLAMGEEVRQDLKLIQATYRLSAQILENDTHQMAPQLLARLLNCKTPVIERLLAGASAPKPYDWLRPVKASLPAPGGTLFTSLTTSHRSVEALAVSPDGKKALSTGSVDHGVTLWDLDLNQVIWNVRGSNDWIWSAAITPDGKRAVTGSYDVVVRDMEDGQELANLGKHSGPVTALVALPDNHRVVSASNDGIFKVWDLERQCELLHFKDQYPFSIAVLPGGNKIIAACFNSLKEWDVDTGELLLSLQEEDFVAHICVAVTPDGKRVAAGDAISGTVKIWDLESGKSLINIKGHQYKWEGPDVDKLRCLSLAITPDGKTLVTASADQTVKVWDMQTGDALRTLGKHADWVTALAPLPDCQRLISGSRDGTMRIWNIHQDPESVQQSFQSDGYIEAFTPDGSCAISARADGVLSLWSLNIRSNIREMIGHKKQACQVRVSTNSRKIVSSSLDGDLMLWDLGASSPTTGFGGGFDIIPNLSITSDAKVAYSATQTYGTVQKVLWDTEKGGQMHPAIFQQDDCTAVLISPDGKYALSANTSKINEKDPRTWVEIRDVQLNQPIAVIENQGWSYISALAVAPDGKRFYALQPQALFEYELPGGRFLRNISGDVEGNFEQVAFLANGRYLACTSWNHKLYVWDLDKGIVVAQFTAESGMFALTSLPGGLILAGDQSGRVHFLQLEIQQGASV